MATDEFRVAFSAGELHKMLINNYVKWLHDWVEKYFWVPDNYMLFQFDE